MRLEAAEDVMSVAVRYGVRPTDRTCFVAQTNLGVAWAKRAVGRHTHEIATEADRSAGGQWTVRVRVDTEDARDSAFVQTRHTEETEWTNRWYEQVDEATRHLPLNGSCSLKNDPLTRTTRFLMVSPKAWTKRSALRGRRF